MPHARDRSGSTEVPPHTALGAATVALFVAAANLRPAIAAVSPLADRIRADLDLSATGVALLTTIPTLAMGICAPLAAVAGRRLGLRHGVLLGLAVVAVATALRGLGQSTWLQLSCAIAMPVPAVVKTRFADRAGLVTGVYTAGLGLGGAVAAGLSAPLADALDSWAGALASWSLVALTGMAVWTAAGRSLRLDGAMATAGPATSGLPWRSGTAWLITALAAGNSALYYCELAWVVPLLREDGGYGAGGAGGLLTALISLQVVAMLAVPALLGERRDARVGLALTTTLTGVGFLGLAAAPGTATWLWIAALGVGHGGLFTLVLALPAVIGRDPGEAGRISALAFFVGYGCAALAPLLVGALRDATGDFHLAFGLLSGVCVALLPAIAGLRRAAAG